MFAPIEEQLEKYPPRKDKVFKRVENNTYLAKNRGIPPRKR